MPARTLNRYLDVNEGQLAQLETAGIEHTPFFMGSNLGVLVSSSDINRIQSALSIISYREEATHYDGIGRIIPTEMAELLQGEEEFLCNIGEWDSEARQMATQRAFSKIIQEILIPIINMPVKLSVPHGHCVLSPTDQDNFYIFCWSCPGENRTRNMRDIPCPPMLLGEQVGCRDAGFTFSGQGIPIHDDNTDWVIGEVLNNCLYIYHDIPHKGINSEVALFEKILDKAVGIILDRDGEAATGRKKELDLQMLIKSREHLKTLLINARRQTMKNFQAALKKVQSIEMQLIGQKRQLDLIKVVIDDHGEKLLEQYASLGQLPQIYLVRRTPTGFKIFTKALDATHPESNKLYELGEYVITVDLSAGVFTCINRTRKVKTRLDRAGMNGPSITASGMMLNREFSSITDLLAAGDLLPAISMIIQILENPDPTYAQFLAQWPRKE